MFRPIVDKIVNLIYTSVVGEGGDGDALWLCRFFTIDELIPILEEYSKDKDWVVKKSEHNGVEYLSWGPEDEFFEEGVIITDNKEFFNSQPDWHTIKIRY